MVDEGNVKQFEGFDFNDYAYLDTSVNPFGANAIGLYVAGANARLAALSALMAATPPPVTGGSAAFIGSQYAWPFHGGAPGPTAVLPNNVAPVQRTLLEVYTNDAVIYFVDERLANYLLAWLGLNPNAGPLGPTAGGWPLPGAVTVHPGVLYEFERKWIWLFYARAVAGQDADVEIYAEG